MTNVSLEEYGRLHGSFRKPQGGMRNGVGGRSRGRVRDPPGFFPKTDRSVSNQRNGFATASTGNGGVDDRTFFQKFGQRNTSDIPHYDDLDMEYNPIERPQSVSRAFAMPVTVVFGNLGSKVRTIDIEQLSSVYGTVTRCELLSDNGVFTGCAEVDFTDRCAAEKTVRAYADKKLDFRPLVCHIKSEGPTPKESVFERVGNRRPADRSHGTSSQKPSAPRAHHRDRKGTNRGEVVRNRSRSARPFMEKKKKSWGKQVSAEALDQELDLYRASGNNAA